MSMLFSAYLEKPSSTNFYGEDVGEHILLLLRRSLITNARWLLLSVVIFTAPVLLSVLLQFANDPLFTGFPKDTAFVATLLWYFFWFFYTFINYLNWFFNVNIVTNKRLVDMDFYDFTHRNITEAPLRSVEDVTHSITGFSQISFNYGTVFIQTAAEKREIEFEFIPKPAKVADMISDLVAEKKLHKEGDNA